MNLKAQTASTMRQFIRRPKPFLAVQLTDENAKGVAQMVNGHLHPGDANAAVRIYFHTNTGRVRADWGDWIVRTSGGYSKLTNEELTKECEEMPA
jgi:hypothetical protein